MLGVNLTLWFNFTQISHFSNEPALLTNTNSPTIIDVIDNGNDNIDDTRGIVRWLLVIG